MLSSSFGESAEAPVRREGAVEQSVLTHGLTCAVQLVQRAHATDAGPTRATTATATSTATWGPSPSAPPFLVPPLPAGVKCRLLERKCSRSALHTGRNQADAARLQGALQATC